MQERVTDLEAEGPRGKEGAGVRLEPKTSDKSVVDSKLVANLGPLTDEKDAFRQWDENMVNVLTHLRRATARRWRVSRISSIEGVTQKTPVEV